MPVFTDPRLAGGAKSNKRIDLRYSHTHVGEFAQIRHGAIATSMLTSSSGPTGGYTGLGPDPAALFVTSAGSSVARISVRGPLRRPLRMPKRVVVAEYNYMVTLSPPHIAAVLPSLMLMPVRP